MRTRFRSTFAGLFLGGLCGGILGALVLGLLTYFDDAHWLSLFTMVGAMGGLVIGGIFGAILGLLQLDRRMGIILGAILGFFLAVGLFVDYVGIFLFVLIPTCSFLGWVIGSTLQARDRMKSMN